jgi:hypothetical protein
MSGRVIRQPIRAVTDPDTAEQRLIRAAVDAHPSTATIGREKKILLALDQNTGDARHVWQRASIAVGETVDYLNAIGSCMSDVKARCFRGPTSV